MNRAVSQSGVGIISQKDMAMVQFAMMGFVVNKPEWLGIYDDAQGLADYSHVWRVLGHLLGMHERFNLCGATYKETLRRVEAVRSEIMVPALEMFRKSSTITLGMLQSECGAQIYLSTTKP